MSSNNTKQSTPYIKLNGTYYHFSSDKEPLSRTHWSNISSDIDDPDNKFDDNHIHDVETQMTNITPRLKPHETGDITRVNTPQFPAITLQELKQALQTYSQKAPGHTKITTHRLKQLLSTSSSLKYKLSQLNLDPRFTKILTNFLSDRTAAIRVANHTGQPFIIKSGVPQGTVISPALYNFYTHDLPPPIPSTDYIAFADDTTQITFSPNSHNMAARLTSRAIAQINQCL
ncbi:Reverse transcriptase domain [Trinorchestia longiramus]|nr:Reverse transcriptase domain [Trinorchestia longiramus]